MDVTAYTTRLQRDLWAAGQAGGEETLAVAERLATVLDSSIRLVLLDALVEAAGEISDALAPGSVEVRLLGRDVQFAVTPPADDAAAPGGTPAPDAAAPTATAATAATADEEDGDGGTARLSLRLPERLKAKVDQAAGAAGLSVNAWLVRSIATLVESPPRSPQPPPAPPTGTWTGLGQRRTGWVR
jgi:hypothetical protein